MTTYAGQDVLDCSILTCFENYLLQSGEQEVGETADGHDFGLLEQGFVRTLEATRLVLEYHVTGKCLIIWY